MDVCKFKPGDLVRSTIWMVGADKSFSWYDCIGLVLADAGPTHVDDQGVRMWTVNIGGSTRTICSSELKKTQ